MSLTDFCPNRGMCLSDIPRTLISSRHGDPQLRRGILVAQEDHQLRQYGFASRIRHDEGLGLSSVSSCLLITTRET